MVEFFKPTVVAGGEDGVHFTLNRFTFVWIVAMRHGRKFIMELILIVFSKGREAKWGVLC